MATLAQILAAAYLLASVTALAPATCDSELSDGGVSLLQSGMHMTVAMQEMSDGTVSLLQSGVRVTPSAMQVQAAAAAHSEILIKNGARVTPASVQAQAAGPQQGDAEFPLASLAATFDAPHQAGSGAPAVAPEQVRPVQTAVQAAPGQGASAAQQALKNPTEHEPAAALQTREGVSQGHVDVTAEQIEQARREARGAAQPLVSGLDLTSGAGTPAMAQLQWEGLAETYKRARAGKLFAIEWRVWKMIFGVVAVAIVLNVAALLWLGISSGEGKAKKAQGAWAHAAVQQAQKQVDAAAYNKAGWGPWPNAWTPPGVSFASVRM